MSPVSALDVFSRRRSQPAIPPVTLHTRWSLEPIEQERKCPEDGSETPRRALRANFGSLVFSIQFHRRRDASPAESGQQIELQLLMRCAQNVINVGPWADSRKCGIFLIGPISSQNPPQADSRQKGRRLCHTARCSSCAATVQWTAGIAIEVEQRCRKTFATGGLALNESSFAVPGLQERRSTGRLRNGCWREKGPGRFVQASAQRQDLMPTRIRRS